MLTIRKEQMRALDATTRRRFEDKILDGIADIFDRQYERLGREQMRQVVRLGATRAAKHGIAGDRPVQSYVALMLMLGAFFDEDVQLPWARAALAAPAVGATTRVDRLYDETMDHLDRVAGAENEHLVKALVRISDFDPAGLEEVPPPRRPEVLAAELARIYPEKAEAQGAEATRAALAGAAALAASHGIRAATGAALSGCCAFMLGSGFAADPQVPWAAQTLALPIPEAEKTAKLHAEARAYVAFGLGR